MTTKEIKELINKIPTTEQKIKFGIYCALEVYDDPEFILWANNWLSGKNKCKELSWTAGQQAIAKMEALIKAKLELSMAIGMSAKKEERLEELNEMNRIRTSALAAESAATAATWGEWVGVEKIAAHEAAVAVFETASWTVHCLVINLKKLAEKAKEE